MTKREKSKLDRWSPPSSPVSRRRPNTIAPTERPLSLAEQRARARWKPPVAAMVADALANNRGLLDRLKRGMYGPDMEHKEQY